ncbi:hypothetical protein SAMN05421835_108187 [Amycolatopsis sacchari]|uniref:Uncharacterized protein n=1 Tax=Amycolatopsis sacchari TaxID=115433 RepID=A0A1I3U1Q8_9PSEU|nr:hypothetical protein [Amycolatopsis sacchari]SFJ76683.1 hypothetical protein SAMN05421835_108187 [Amycolatopsis sacchari]
MSKKNLLALPKKNTLRKTLALAALVVGLVWVVHQPHQTRHALDQIGYAAHVVFHHGSDQR